jgi:hypothetical protein
MKNLTPRITDIELSQFQVFGDTVCIPIAPITLLFGPNSAGKSSVEDALRLMKAFWLEAFVQNTDGKFSQTGNRSITLSRDWRKDASNQYVNQSLKVAVGIECFTYELFDPSLMTMGVLPFDLLNNTDLVRFQVIVEFSAPISNPQICIEIKINEISFYKFRENESLSINLRHTIFPNPKARIPVTTEYTKNKSPITYNKWVQLDGPVVMTDIHEIDTFKFIKQLELKKNLPADLRGFYEAINQLSDFNRIILGHFSKLIVQACSINLVTASRTTPSDNELFFILDKNRQVVDPQRYGIGLESDEQYKDLVRAAALSVLLNNKEIDPTEDELKAIEVVDKINHLLEMHLFTDRVYSLDADVTKFVPLARAGGNPIDPIAWLASLRICDAMGRRHSFTDVGSGLGYVLPVFLALVGRTHCLIQQPELHLHPALQAEIADALIESSKKFNVIVETHSEHLLLRLLRRIRLTSAGSRLNVDHPLTPTDVAIIYFEPKADDVTHLTVLQITEQGDFIGRWPRGFFTERDEELFGE